MRWPTSCCSSGSSAGTRASDLTRQLLIYAGKDRVQGKPFHVNGLLAENKGLFEAIVPKRVQLTFDLGDGLPAVEGDIGQIQQVLMNLIMNASEAIGAKNGHVRVQSSRCLISGQSNPGPEYTSSGALAPGLYVSVIVQDDGSGMDQKTRDRIFDPFFSTKGSGRGLGLPATLGIIHQHKGSLRVTSQPGKGTTFQVLLPPAASEAPGEAAPANEALLAPMQGTVLVIDDEAVIRDAFAETLRTVGLHVLTAENGRQGLALFRAHRAAISLVVLDIQMPVMGGGETLQEMLALDPDVAVLLTSGYSDCNLPGSVLLKPSIVFLQKPYPIETFLRTVKQQLNARRGPEGAPAAPAPIHPSPQRLCNSCATACKSPAMRWT
jgi:FixJ family two-component response regulator